MKLAVWYFAAVLLVTAIGRCSMQSAWPPEDRRVARIVGVATLDDDPLPGVSILVSGRSFHASAVTDRNGNFAIDGMPAGAYTVTAGLLGINALRISRTELPPGSELRLAIRMTRKQLPTISVTGLYQRRFR